MVTDVLTAAALKADAVAEIQAGLATAGEYDAELTVIQADLDDPDQYKADVSALALEATLGNATYGLAVLKELIDALTGYVDTEIAAIKTVVDAILADTGTDGVVVGSHTAAAKAEIQAEAEDALIAKNLDHLMKTAVADSDDMTAEVADGTVLSNIMTKDGDTSDFVPATDSLEKLGERLATATITTTTAVSGSTINFTIAQTFDETLSGLTIPSTWTKMYLTVKAHPEDEADTAAVMQIMKTNPADATNDGLIRLKAAAYATKSHGALTVNQAAGTVGITIADDALATFTREYDGLTYDLKVLCSDGTSEVLATGEVNVSYTPTRAIT